MNSDRITECYYGDPSDPFTQRCRDRIHWTCAQVQNGRVLDIGCSQGIVSLILAREGFDCTGIDIERASIDRARLELEKEQEQVRGNLKFLLADASTLPFEDHSFDSVIMGEILEHLTHPERILGEAVRVLKKQGRAIITVPYGLSPHHDHKRTFYPASFLDTVEPFFEVTSINTSTHYIFFCGTPRAQIDLEACQGSPIDRWELQREVEQRCLAKELELLETSAKLHDQIQTLKSRLNASTEAARERHDALALKREDWERKVHAKEVEAKDKQAAELLRRKDEEWERKILAKELAAKDKQIAELLKRKDEEWERKVLVREVEALKAQVQDLSNKYSESGNKTIGSRAIIISVAERVRQVVHSALPEECKLIVISKGDDSLLQFQRRVASHFPQEPGGKYAGYHPSDSTAAISHLEELREGGAEFLVIPCTAFWWLEHYDAFKRHLDSRYHLAAYQEDTCLIFDLGSQATSIGQRLAFEIRYNPHTKGFRSNSLQAPQKLDPARQTLMQEAGQSNGSGTAAVPAPIVIASPMQRQSHTNLPKWGPRIALGAILDEFTMDCLQPECDLVTFRPDNWRCTLESYAPNIIFVESAWRGNEGSWQYRIAKYARNMGNELVDLLQWARDKKIPSVFWNKEDPVHFDRFIECAAAFDFVLTSDANCVPKYRDRLGHERVAALSFAAQPAIHNPILEQPRRASVCFAGTYYGDRHEQRRNHMEHILKPALDFGLEIYDRQHGLTGAEADLYRFPDIYKARIKGRLQYDQMVKAYKDYRVFLNVNSVTDSPTMFSRRVFELLACGTPVISTHSRGILQLLGEDVVFISESETDTRNHLERLLSDSETWARASVAGIRKVMTEHIYAKRLKEVFDCLGLDSPEVALPRLTVLAKLAEFADIEKLIGMLRKQTHRQFDLILLSDTLLPSNLLQRLRNGLEGSAVANVPFGSEDAHTQCLAVARSDYFALFDVKDHYGPNYLKDFALAVMYSGAPFLGKHSFFKLSDDREKRVICHPGHEFTYVETVPSATLVSERHALTKNVFWQCFTNGVFESADRRILSIDSFNYLQSPKGDASGGATEPGDRLAESVGV